jgi:hypothetical protein
MQTLAPPTLTWPDLKTPSCEQVITGDSTPETDDGTIGSGPPEEGVEPEPLQGGSDEAEAEWESDTGSEGAGT